MESPFLFCVLSESFILVHRSHSPLCSLFTRIKYIRNNLKINQLIFYTSLSGDGEAKFQVGEEITLMVNKGMKPKDIKLAESIIEENKEVIITEWIKIYGK